MLQAAATGESARNGGNQVTFLILPLHSSSPGGIKDFTESIEWLAGQDFETLV
jgi:hypothetical protein